MVAVCMCVTAFRPSPDTKTHQPPHPQVPVLITNAGTTMHNMIFAHHVYKGKPHVGTSGMGATEGKDTPAAVEEADKRKLARAYNMATNVHGAPKEKKKDFILKLVQRVRACM